MERKALYQSQLHNKRRLAMKYVFLQPTTHHCNIMPHDSHRTASHSQHNVYCPGFGGIRLVLLRKRANCRFAERRACEKTKLCQGVSCIDKLHSEMYVM